LRLMECVRLRVKDVDCAYHQITVRDGKGAQDCVTMLPQSVEPGLQRHLERVKLLHQADLLEGFGAVYLPVCVRTERAKRGAIMGMAICLSCVETLPRSAFGCGTSAPSGRDCTPEGRQGSHTPGGAPQARELSYPET
jgi:hypothetical protein